MERFCRKKRKWIPSSSLSHHLMFSILHRLLLLLIYLLTELDRLNLLHLHVDILSLLLLVLRRLDNRWWQRRLLTARLWRQRLRWRRSDFRRFRRRGGFRARFAAHTAALRCRGRWDVRVVVERQTRVTASRGETAARACSFRQMCFVAILIFIE